MFFIQIECKYEYEFTFFELALAVSEYEFLSVLVLTRVLEYELACTRVPYLLGCFLDRTGNRYPVLKVTSFGKHRSGHEMSVVYTNWHPEAGHPACG